ncbi:MAG: MurR/RpiR family transcriptional regulator [Burkholderiales bacterium]|jgi:DNA-binding MurR/RpiR family transcriptional regulator|nr:MurR/RpiR family transcriptional regulator [Burkholderiales bacterium]
MDAQAVTRAKAPRRAPRRAGAADSQVDRLLARVATDFEALPRQLKSVARYVEQHRARVMVDRIGDVARECAVQPSAVVRFAQRFGYAGFSAMQAVFRDDYTQQAAASTTYQQRIRRLVTSKRRALTPVAVAREFVAASTAGLEELSRDFDDAALSSAVSLLARAQHIYVVGVRRSYPVAAYMTYALQHIDKRVQLVDGIGGMVHEQMRSIGRDDVIVAISFTPYGRETLACVRHAQKCGAKSVVMTDSRLAPLARGASALLVVREGGAFAFRSLTNALCLAQALFVALAYRLELDVEETTHRGDYDD